MAPLTTTLRAWIRALANPSLAVAERQLLLTGRIACDRHRERRQLACLADAEFSVSSQWGEDGIIEWLVQRLPAIPETFVEFGVQGYREANTRFLLQNRNWRGLVIDGTVENIDDIRGQPLHWKHDLTATCAFIDRDNIDELIAGGGLSGPIGLLSIDIDGNDYWVWEAITVVEPVIVVCEFNALFGESRRVSTPYRRDFVRRAAHHSNLFFGASLPAMISLAERKSYRFVGTCSNGVNAFFIRADRAPEILSSLDTIKSFPSALRESRDAQGRLTFARGSARVAQIAHLEVFDFDRQSMVRVGDLHL